MISRLFRQDPVERSVAEVYVRLAERARDPSFYLRCAVPDTLDGRFDMLVLHVVILLDRLAGRGEKEAAFAQALVDRLFADMDVSLREMGVGDLSVGKKVKTMGEAFYGRVRAYSEALARDGGELAEALRRNLYRGADASPAQIDAMAAYVRRESEAMAATPLDDLLAARLRFGPLPSDPLPAR